jgi:hypothetical protein
MALSEAEKTDIRRYCGYPARGEGGFGYLWPPYRGQANLEFRMNNLSAPEEAVLRRHLGTLLLLESAVPKAGENLDTDQAASWSRNRSEQDDRLRLLDTWRRRLCHFLGVPPGPGLDSGSGLTVVV